MPDPFVASVDLELSSILTALTTLRAELAALSPRIFVLEAQAQALRTYRATLGASTGPTRQQEVR